MQLTQVLPMPRALPVSLPSEGAINLTLEQGVLIFRASHHTQARIEALLDKQKATVLTSDEEKELDQYEEIDDYLSYLNRLIRNLAQDSEDLRAA